MKVIINDLLITFHSLGVNIGMDMHECLKKTVFYTFTLKILFLIKICRRNSISDNRNRIVFKCFECLLLCP